MILAAGLGTRLRPLTDTLPKCLVEVGGVTMLERTARRLVAAGADRLVVNVCPFADDVVRFVESRRGFGVETRISREAPTPLETGGGLLAARAHFRGDAPFLLHNVDVFTDMALRAMYEAHVAAGPLTTLAVEERTSSRRLLFDDLGLLGRVDDSHSLRTQVREPSGTVRALAFGGVHVVSPAIFDLLTERSAFSIVDAYLRLAAEGHRVLPHRVDGCAWIDVGRPEQLAEADRRSRA